MCFSKCFFHTKHWMFILGTSAHMPRLYCMLGKLGSFWALGTLTHSGDRPSWEEPCHNFYIASINIDIAMESDPQVDDVPMISTAIFRGINPSIQGRSLGKHGSAAVWGEAKGAARAGGTVTQNPGGSWGGGLQSFHGSKAGDFHQILVKPVKSS